MKKQDIKKLEWWKWVTEFDFIYIVPTNKKSNWYKLAYYIGKIWDEYKIIDLYDCGSIFQEVEWYISIRWDFEDILWWIKIWNDYWKIKYRYWWSLQFN